MSYVFVICVRHVCVCVCVYVLRDFTQTVRISDASAEVEVGLFYVYTLCVFNACMYLSCMYVVCVCHTLTSCVCVCVSRDFTQTVHISDASAEIEADLICVYI